MYDEDDSEGLLAPSLQAAQLEAVFHPLYRLSFGGLMMLLGIALVVYGAIDDTSVSCNDLADYDLGSGSLLVVCGLSYILGVCVSRGNKTRMQLHMFFDMCCLGVPLIVLFVCVNFQYWSLSDEQKEHCPQNLQTVSMVYLAFVYVTMFVNVCCAPCIAWLIKPESGGGEGNKHYTFRDEKVDHNSRRENNSRSGGDIYIQTRNQPYGQNPRAGTGYADEDSLLDA